MELGVIARMRILVSHLGEIAEEPWWSSAFTTEAGLDFATYTFPRSHVSAAIAGAVVAARHVHDERIGRQGTRHLFRFHGGLERAVHREILEADQEQLLALVGTYDDTLAQLRRLARQTVDAPDGPVQVGRLGQEEEEYALVDVAAHYVSGFETGRLVFPYFAGSR